MSGVPLQTLSTSHWVKKFHPFKIRPQTSSVTCIHPLSKHTCCQAPPLLSLFSVSQWAEPEPGQSRAEWSCLMSLSFHSSHPPSGGWMCQCSHLGLWAARRSAALPFRNIPLRPGVAPLPSLTCLFAFPAAPAIWAALMNSTCTLWILCAWDRRGGPKKWREEEWPHPPSWGLGIDWLKTRASTKSAPPSGNEGLVW